MHRCEERKQLTVHFSALLRRRDIAIAQVLLCCALIMFYFSLYSTKQSVVRWCLAAYKWPCLAYRQSGFLTASQKEKKKNLGGHEWHVSQRFITTLRRYKHSGYLALKTRTHNTSSRGISVVIKFQHCSLSQNEFMRSKSFEHSLKVNLLKPSPYPQN